MLRTIVRSELQSVLTGNVIPDITHQLETRMDGLQKRNLELVWSANSVLAHATVVSTNSRIATNLECSVAIRTIDLNASEAKTGPSHVSSRSTTESITASSRGYKNRISAD